MTNEQINLALAGVMGWDVMITEPITDEELKTLEPTQVWKESDLEPWNPTESLDQAWEVANHVKKHLRETQGRQLVLEIYSGNRCYAAFDDLNDLDYGIIVHQEEGDTMTRALCIATLKAAGKWEE